MAHLLGIVLDQQFFLNRNGIHEGFVLFWLSEVLLILYGHGIQRQVDDIFRIVICVRKGAVKVQAHIHVLSRTLKWVVSAVNLL